MMDFFYWKKQCRSKNNYTVLNFNCTPSILSLSSRFFPCKANHLQNFSVLFSDDQIRPRLQSAVGSWPNFLSFCSSFVFPPPFFFTVNLNWSFFRVLLLMFNAQTRVFSSIFADLPLPSLFWSGNILPALDLSPFSAFYFFPKIFRIIF